MADESLGTPAESPLAPAILRGLGDRSYDKRKNAALEIEALIKTLEDNNETDRICSIIVLLGQDFATSTNPNHRKGGLIGLAASSIGLMSVRAIGGACPVRLVCLCGIFEPARADTAALSVSRVDLERRFPPIAFVRVTCLRRYSLFSPSIGHLLFWTAAEDDCNECVRFSFV